MTKILANFTLLVALAQAVLVALSLFGVDISKEQAEAIIGVIAALGALVGAWAHPSIPVGNTAP